MKDMFSWLSSLLKIQSLMNNTCSFISSISSNEIVNELTLYCLLFLFTLLNLPDHIYTRISTSDTIANIIILSKNHYDMSHKLFFFMVKEYNLLRIYKYYSILFITRVTNKSI